MQAQELRIDKQARDHLGNYRGPLAVEYESLVQHINKLEAIDLSAHLLQQSSADSKAQRAAQLEADSSFELTSDGVALISLEGLLLKRASSFAMSTSTVAARRAIRAATDSPDVEAIVLKVESPGGTAAGIPELAQSVRDARAQKPVVVFGEDMVASAAMWVSAQADAIIGNELLHIGSIGVFSVFVDSSEAAEQQGFKVHLVTTGPFKGAGTSGVPITDEQLAHWQALIDSVHSMFVDAVATGRSLARPQVVDMADGRVHRPTAAVELGLMDSVGGLDDAITMALRLRGSPRMSNQVYGPDGKPVASDKQTDTAPTIAQLREACPGADDSFVLEQVEQKASLADATRKWCAVLAERDKKSAERIAELEKAQAEATDAPPKRGAQPVGVNKKDDSKQPAASGDFWTLVSEKEAAGMNRQAAIRKVVEENPDAHRAMLDEHNARNNRPKAVSAYYGD